MKATVILIVLGLLIIVIPLSLLSKPSYNSGPGCSGSGCHSFSDGDVSVVALDNLQVEVTVTGTSNKVAGELIDENGNVVDYINSTTANPFILSAPSAGVYIVNAGYKSPLMWDSSSVALTGTTPPQSFPVDLFGTTLDEKTITINVAKPGNAPNTASYQLTAFDPDHGGTDPPEGHAFINGNGPIELFPGATQQNGDVQTRDFTFIVPSNWWIDGDNELKFVRLYSTGYRIDTAYVLFDGVSGIDDENQAPEEFILSQNYPNPFNPSTKIRFSVLSDDTENALLVQLIVYDILGKEVVTLVNEEKLSGNYEVEFSAIGVSAFGGNAYTLTSGIYFYQLKTGNFTETKKMILMR